MAKNENIITETATKVMIKWGRLSEALNEEEIKNLNEIVDKIKSYDREGK